MSGCARKGATSHDDNAFDVLVGKQGSDWFWANFQGAGVPDGLFDVRDRGVYQDCN